MSYENGARERSRRESVHHVVDALSKHRNRTRRASTLRHLIGIVRSSFPHMRASRLSPIKEASTRFQRLVLQFRNCLGELAAEVTDVQLERWACLIYESMSAPSRTFHSVQHVFDISVDADPIQMISAFFHDVIYYHVDGGLSQAQEEVLKGIVREDDEKKVFLQDTDLESDRAIALVVALFGFESGQELNPFKGLNEFLSAALACRCLEGTLGLPHIAQIVTCIEATIPFRKPENGKTAMEHLYDRLQKVNSSFDLGLSDDDIVKAMKRAVNLSNRDVGNFSTPEHAHFLSGTWNLLPESNITLRHTSVFRISDFTLALKKMAGFFSSLDPANIFASFQDEPNDVTLLEMRDRARSNLNVALKYMHCKLLSISVLGALAEQTGGDAPVAMFLGDLPEPDHISPSIEDYINVSSAQEQEEAGLDETVYNLLRYGRETDTSFDLKNSPLAAYLYGLMRDEGLYRSLEYAVYPMDGDNAGRLLDSLPREAVRTIALACAGIAITRAERLRKIAKEYSD